MQTLQRLTRYKAWADEVFLSALRDVPHQVLAAPQPIVFGSLLRTLHHAQAMDRVWRAHLLGEPHGLATRDPEHCPPLDEIASAQRALDRWFVAYADAATQATLDAVVMFEFIGGGAGAMARGDMLLHVVNHATYHRGHMADMLYRAGHRPPVTDLPVFLREQAAAEAAGAAP